MFDVYVSVYALITVTPITVALITAATLITATDNCNR